jgi:hypothetical protein
MIKVKRKKIEAAKDSFLLVCQQYEALGGFMAAEVQALNENNVAAAMEARQRFNAQFYEAGQQLKNLGASIDELGGPPILLPTGEVYRRPVEPEEVYRRPVEPEEVYRRPVEPEEGDECSKDS